MGNLGLPFPQPSQLKPIHLSAPINSGPTQNLAEIIHIYMRLYKYSIGFFKRIILPWNHIDLFVDKSKEMLHRPAWAAHVCRPDNFACFAGHTDINSTE